MLSDKQREWLTTEPNGNDLLEATRVRLAAKGLCRHPGVGQPMPAKEGGRA